MSEEAPLHLVVGLGNPGPEYDDTRHNLGFALVDRVAARAGQRLSKWEHDALTARATIDGVPVALAKPQTFMNVSGPSVAALVRWYRVEPERVLILYDDVDLPLGRLRIRAEGSAGGHRGMTSVLSSLGTRAIARIRLGIGRPGDDPMVEHVLSKFRKPERAAVDSMLEEAADAVRTFLAEGIVAAMNRHNRRDEGE